MSSRKKNPRRKTIGQSPLDGILGPSVPKNARESQTKVDMVTPARRSKSAPEPKRVSKVRATFHIPADLLDECRNAVVWLAGPPERLTMARLAENALRREIARLRKKHTKGEAFPERSGELRGGRPIGS